MASVKGRGVGSRPRALNSVREHVITPVIGAAAKRHSGILEFVYREGGLSE